MTRRPLDRALAEALADLERTSGTLTVGSLVRPDVPADVVRFLEGRYTALRAVDEALRTAQVPSDVEPAVVAAYADRVLTSWRSALETALAGSPRDEGEVARRRGGVTALTDLVGVLDARR